MVVVRLCLSPSASLPLWSFSLNHHLSFTPIMFGYFTLYFPCDDVTTYIFWPIEVPHSLPSTSICLAGHHSIRYVCISKYIVFIWHIIIFLMNICEYHRRSRYTKRDTFLVARLRQTQTYEACVCIMRTRNNAVWHCLTICIRLRSADLNCLYCLFVFCFFFKYSSVSLFVCYYLLLLFWRCVLSCWSQSVWIGAHHCQKDKNDLRRFASFVTDGSELRAYTRIDQTIRDMNIGKCVTHSVGFLSFWELQELKKN